MLGDEDLGDDDGDEGVADDEDKDFSEGQPVVRRQAINKAG